jgi:hypothetical protein
VTRDEFKGVLEGELDKARRDVMEEWDLADPAKRRRMGDSAARFSGLPGGRSVHKDKLGRRSVGRPPAGPRLRVGR